MLSGPFSYESKGVLGDMGTRVIYEIARYSDGDDPENPTERVQLLSVGSVLVLRDSDGTESPCENSDIAAAFASMRSLREIRAGEKTAIVCDPEISAKLPFLLTPVLDGDDPSECYVDVNGVSWAALRDIDGDYVVLPGWDADDEPEMTPCWAKQAVEEGEWNPLTGYTSIGLATSSVVVEYANHDYGGLGGGAAVRITQFDDFATIFIEWLLNMTVLSELWEGDTPPYSPSVQLFAKALSAAELSSGWSTDIDQDGQHDEDEDEDDDDDDDENQDDQDESRFASAQLELHLSEELIEQARARLRSLDPEYALILGH